MMTMRKFFAILIALLAGAASSVSHAGSFSVTPVRLYFNARDRAVAVTLTNDGDAEIALQADINVWSQDANGVDKLELTEDLIVAPPSLKLAAHAKQVVRLALVTPRDATRQMTYRLIVREVPEAVASKEGNVQLPIALVLSMPVFITPPIAKRQMNFTLVRATGQSLQAVTENVGSAYAQVRDVELRRNGQALARFEGVNYVLPGARKSLALKTEGGDVTSGDAELVVTFDDSAVQTYRVTVP